VSERKSRQMIADYAIERVLFRTPSSARNETSVSVDLRRTNGHDELKKRLLFQASSPLRYKLLRPSCLKLGSGGRISDIRPSVFSVLFAMTLFSNRLEVQGPGLLMSV
jgi:hypothetical protein